MSELLLWRVSSTITRLVPALSAYAVRYYRWTDADLNGDGQIALYRMFGSSGVVNSVVQFHDVSLTLMSSRDESPVQTDTDMLAVLRALRKSYEAPGVFNLYPVGSYTGPEYMQNDRAVFEMVIRCGVEDH